MVAQEQVCDCCLLRVVGGQWDYCPRCRYPLNRTYETQFLERSLGDLRRVALYGGAGMTVDQLIRRYIARLDVLRQPIPAPPVMAALPVSPNVTPQSVPPDQTLHNNESVISPSPQTTAQPVGPRQVLSFRTFLAEQTINIVAVLGAFLILAGSLGFIVSTSSLSLSFVIILVVYAIFGITGLVTHRFPSLRIVSTVYTAIFGLLLPLVGLALYRLIVQQQVSLSASATIVIIALYAVCAYTALALYQRLQFFVYLALASLVAAVFAVDSLLHLQYWWWILTLLALALPSLLIELPDDRFPAPLVIVRLPVRIFMFICVLISLPGIGLAYIQSLFQDLPGIRYVFVVFFSVLLVWSCLYSWMKRGTPLVVINPYLLFFLVTVGCYAAYLPTAGYLIAFTLLAWFCYLLTDIKMPPHRFSALREIARGHLEFLTLFLVWLVSFIVSPSLFSQLLDHTSFSSAQGNHQVFQTAIIDILVLLAGCALFVSKAIYHSGWQKVPRNRIWCYTLLLAAYPFSCLIGILAQIIGGDPFWWYLAVSLLLIVGTVLVRRLMDTGWSDPLDLVALFFIGQTFFLSLVDDRLYTLALLLGLAALVYCLLIYQRRHTLIGLSLLFILSAAFILRHYPVALFFACIVLPFVAVAVRYVTRLDWFSQSSRLSAWRSRFLPWEWPLVVSGLCYGLFFFWHELGGSASTVQQWLAIPFSSSLEMVLFALIWYVTLLLTRVRVLACVPVGFVLLSFFFSGTPVWIIFALACVLILLAVGIDRWLGVGWAASLYICAILLVLSAGYHGWTENQGQSVIWGMVIFSLLVYASGVMGKRSFLLWVAPFFALLSVWAADHSGNLYYAPGVALVCVVVGIGIAIYGSLETVSQNPDTRQLTRSRFSSYVVALACVVLLGARGSLSGIAQPFEGAIPLFLLCFAVIAFVIMLVERKPALLLIVGILPMWAIALMPWVYWQSALAYMLLALCLFATQIVWRPFIASRERMPFVNWHVYSGLTGQGLIALMACYHVTFISSASLDYHVGAIAFLMLSLLFFLAGRIWEKPVVQRYCAYTAGFLVSLIVPWELQAFQYTRIDELVLVPATYLVVLSPFLARDDTLPGHDRISHLCAILGSAFLLLPTLWLSFSLVDLQSTLILGIESFLLFLLGVLTRIRIFVMGGAAFVVICAMHVLFLPSLGLSPSLALGISGLILLVFATSLSFARQRLQRLWGQLH